MTGSYVCRSCRNRLLPRGGRPSCLQSQPAYYPGVSPLRSFTNAPVPAPLRDEEGIRWSPSTASPGSNPLPPSLLNRRSGRYSRYLEAPTPTEPAVRATNATRHATPSVVSRPPQTAVFGGERDVHTQQARTPPRHAEPVTGPPIGDPVTLQADIEKLEAQLAAMRLQAKKLSLEKQVQELQAQVAALQGGAPPTNGFGDGQAQSVAQQAQPQRVTQERRATQEREHMASNRYATPPVEVAQQAHSQRASQERLHISSDRDALSALEEARQARPHRVPQERQHIAPNRTDTLPVEGAQQPEAWPTEPSLAPKTETYSSYRRSSPPFAGRKRLSPATISRTARTVSTKGPIKYRHLDPYGTRQNSQRSQSTVAALSQHDQGYRERDAFDTATGGGETPQGELLVLGRMLHDRSEPLGTVWSYFLKHFGSRECPAFVQPSLQDLTGMARGSAFQKLLRALTEHWLMHGSADGVPTPTTVIEKFEEVVLMRPEYYGVALWAILGRIHQAIASGQVGAVPLATQFGELTAVWKMCFARYGDKAEDSVPKWHGLPDVTDMDAVALGADTTSSLGLRLKRFLPRLVVGEESRVYPAALVTFDLVVHHAGDIGISAAEKDESEPLIQLFARLLIRAWLRPHQKQFDLMLRYMNVPMEYLATKRQQFREIPTRAVNLVGMSTCGGTSEALETFYIKRVGRAVETADLRAVKDIWSQAQLTFVAPGSDSKPNIPVRLYNHLLQGLMRMRQPDFAIEVWNAMFDNGTKPELATWTAMLAGCTQAKDYRTMEKIWDMMISSGAKPDVHAWTTRINCLLSHGARDKGLQVLEDMGRQWKQAVASALRGQKRPSDVPEDAIVVDAPKPTTETLNAALTPLARMQRRDLIQRLFRWAEQYSIQADVITYNILLRMALLDRRMDEAENLLESMEKSGVEPDIATFTIIIDFKFKHAAMEQASEEEQTTHMISFIEELTARGLKVNGIVFATIIDGLLKQQGNLPAAQAVLGYMAARGIAPSPHIYTMLATHHFQQDPPDLTALDALWAAVRRAGVPTDVVFYDRLVEGYARVDARGPMMTALQQMAREGKQPGWEALVEVLKALARAGDREAIVRLVRDVVVGAEGLVPRERGRMWYRRVEFWRLVGELGVQPEGLGKGGEEGKEGGGGAADSSSAAASSRGSEETVRRSWIRDVPT